MKLAFLSDLHAGPAMGKLGKAVWGWALQQLIAEKPQVVVLGGDLWQTAANAGSGDWLPALLAALPEAAFYSVPGNRDPQPFALGGWQQSRIQCVADSLASSSPTLDLLLVNSNICGRSLCAVIAMLQGAGRGRSVLAVMHHPLCAEDLAAVAATCEAQAVDCVLLAGHEHRHSEQRLGRLLQVTSAGLDPLKTIDGLPEIQIVESGEGSEGRLSVRTLSLCPEQLWPASPQGRAREVVVGIAPYGPLGQLLEAGLEHRISAIQALSHMQTPLPMAGELEALKQWRAAVPESFLSYHMPDPDLSDKAGPMGGLEPHVQWCVSAGVQDCTIHLPAVAADLVYADGGRGDFLETPLVTRIKEIYKNLARSVLLSGGDCQLSIENHHNTAEHFSGTVPDRLSSRPEHIFRMICWLRGQLLLEGLGDSLVQRVGWIFDSGHARNNGAVTNELTLADWIELGERFLQAAHIHQVHSDAKEYAKNHFQICAIHEALVNHEGLLAAFARTRGRPLRAFVEVRKLGEAVTSWKLLHELVASRCAVPAAGSGGECLQAAG